MMADLMTRTDSRSRFQAGIEVASLGRLESSVEALP